MPPREEMDPWQQPPPSGGSHWGAGRDHAAYYGESRQQTQPYGGNTPTSPYPPQQYARPSASRPPIPIRRMPPYEGGYSRGGGGRAADAYYDRGWQEQQQQQQPSPHRLHQTPQLPYRTSEERPYMPLYDEMRPMGQPGGAPPPSVRIQFRPNADRHRRPSHKPQPSRKAPASPSKREKASSSSSKSADNKEKKDKDALTLLAKVSFAMQSSPTGSQDEGDEQSKAKHEGEKEQVTPTRKTQDQTNPRTESPQKLPAPSPLVAVTGSDVSPISPEVWTPKASNSTVTPTATAVSASSTSPGHRRVHSGGSILRTPRGRLTPLITPASSHAAGMTPRSHHRRTHSGGGPVDIYHQRWAEGPPTPHMYSPYPPRGGGGSEYSREYLTMEHIASPPDARGQQASPPQRRGGPPPYPFPPPPRYRDGGGWDRGGGGPPPPSADPSVWRPRGGEGYDQQPPGYPEEYPPIVTRGSSYEEEGGRPPQGSRYHRYPPPLPEPYAEQQQQQQRGEYWRERPPPHYEGGPYSPPRGRRVPQDSRRMPHGMSPYPQQQQPVTPSAQDMGQPPQDSRYITAPYTYVQQPRLEEKTVLRKKFSWKHYPELERFLIANRDEYLRHSALNYTAEQKQYNNWLTERLLEVAARYNYEFDPEEFNFVAVRDRIRCYYKSYVQTARKRGITIHGLKSPVKKPKKDEQQESSTKETTQEETTTQEEPKEQEGNDTTQETAEQDTKESTEPPKPQEGVDV